MISTGAVKTDPARARSRAYPLSRWYVIPLARQMASWLNPTRVRPTHVTLAGLLFGLSAAGVLFADPTAGTAAAVLVLAAWFMDRTDGLLARSQNTASPFGAWLDANVDELHEVAWHTATACAAASLSGSQMPWFLLIGFLAGKYLFMTGLAEERALAPANKEPVEMGGEAFRGRLRAAYHLPGNADIRLHLLVVALACGLMTAELAFIAVYYNIRWIVRYGLTAQRVEGCR